MDGEVIFERGAWLAPPEAMPVVLSDDDLAALLGINAALDLDEVTRVYLPLARLVSAAVVASASPSPFVLAVTGSVAVGKSTIALVLEALLSSWPEHPRVDVVSTDGFLFPNAVLLERGIMQRKGFPESYDTGAFVSFLEAVKAGDDEVTAPVYSHDTYDIVPGSAQVVRQPDILIIEGVDTLQHETPLIDCAIYVDADEDDIVGWYLPRFMSRLRGADEGSFFSAFAHLDDGEATAMATQVWQTVNSRNLAEHILPTRARADLVVRKGADHRVHQIWRARR